MNRYTVILFSSALLMCGCFGHSLDKDLTYGSPTRHERLGTRDIRLDIQLMSDTSKPVPGVEVTAEYRLDVQTGVTSSEGKTSMVVELAEEDGIDFYFKSDNPRIDGTRTLHKLPLGENIIKILFKVDRRGRVRLVNFVY